MGTGHTFSKLTIENGLSNNQVNAIYKDSYGFIWIGTLDGIDRFDGIEIRPYNFKFYGSVENVKSITEDYDRNLWVGTSSNLFRYNKNNDKFEKVNIDTIKTNIQKLVMLPDSNLCIATTNGVYLIKTNSFQSEKLHFSNLPEKRNINVTDILPDNPGSCWLTTTFGLIRYSFSDKKSEFFQCNLMPYVTNNTFSSLCSIGNKLYLGTSGAGIIEFDLYRKVFSVGIQTDNKIIINITSNNKDHIYAGTNGGGLIVVNTQTQEVENIVNKVNDPESLSSNSVYSFLLDEDGRYWIGTYSEGLCFTKNINDNFKIHPFIGKYPEVNRSVRSFYFSPDGSQYLGTRNGFVQISKDGTLKLFQSSDKETELRSNIILSVYPFMGDILIGTYGGGVSRYSVSEKKMKPFLKSDILTQGNIYAFDSDTAGFLWITSFNGLYRYSVEDNTIINFNTQNSSLKDDQIFEIMFDSKGRMWIGSMSGTYVYKFQDNKIEPVDLPVISNNSFKTNYIYEDQVGNVWICTERGGLIRINPELTLTTTFNDENGLPDNSVCAIIERRSGIYWISTLKGLCKYSTQSQKFTKYTMSNGLPGLVFTKAAIYLDRNGTLFFGNERGLVYFTPEEVDKLAYSSKIQITHFYLSGNEVLPGEGSVLKQIIEETDEIHLNSRMNNLGFRFVALNYNNPADNNYQYKLEGFDKVWKDNGNKNTVFYQNLKSGNYVFKVRNANDADIDSPNNAEVKIIIHRTLTKSPFFYLFLFLIALTGGFILIRYIKILQQKAKQIIGLPQKLEKYKGSRILQSRCELIISEMRHYMEEEKPYLNADLKLADLANKVNHPINEISQVLNQYLNQSFSDFINKYRVEEVKKLMADKVYGKYTLIAIARQCGFNSKTSFYRIFKNETGKTPSDFIKNIERQTD